MTSADVTLVLKQSEMKSTVGVKWHQTAMHTYRIWHRLRHTGSSNVSSLQDADCNVKDDSWQYAQGDYSVGESSRYD